jgi:23S rRNA (cytidine1920-2'-O)/16S rRNA (cytidine1409-2'-O)-methyltransferase
MQRRRKRIDILLVELNLAKSREKAKEYIRERRVYVDGKPILKPSTLISIDSNIYILREKDWVGRGAKKLCFAIEKFGVDIDGKICMDVGAGTGGFTECLLYYGAKKVYAVDVGYGQFDYSLRNSHKVILYERTNFRYMPSSLVDEKIDIFVMDVSFISIKKLVGRFFDFGKTFFSGVVLIKPQFEAKKGAVKKGILRDKEMHILVLKDIHSFLVDYGLYPISYTYSPIKGAKGNIEYFVYFTNLLKDGMCVAMVDVIDNVVEEAFCRLG